MAQRFHHLKSLGQHFLKSEEVAADIVRFLEPKSDLGAVLEIGPGLGILSKILLQSKHTIYFSEIDPRIIQFLKTDLQVPASHILEGDFLRTDPFAIIQQPFAIIGNFPYNISSQILFRVLEQKEHIPLVVGMFQKEMAKRVVATHGNKDFGVITVLVQAFYDVEYLLELEPDAFDPPPKVHSAVIRLTRKSTYPDCTERMLRIVVKAAFNQRRKKLSNALSSVEGGREALIQLQFEHLRAEQLSVNDFILLAKTLETR